MLSITSHLKRTTLANVAGFTIALTGLGAAIYYQKWELAGTIIGAGIGYLFKQPKTDNGNGEKAD